MMKLKLILIIPILILFSCNSKIDKPHQPDYVDKSHQQNSIDSFTIRTFGMTPPQEYTDAINIVSKNWKIKFKREAGCVPEVSIQENISILNEVANKNIENKYGYDWRIKFDKEVSLQVDTIKFVHEIINNLSQVKQTLKIVESKQGFLNYKTKKSRNKNEYIVIVTGLESSINGDIWKNFYEIEINVANNKIIKIKTLK